jgi:hypothetical protein
MVPIPEGSESYEGESDHTDYGGSQESLDQPIDLRGSGAPTELEQMRRRLGSGGVHELNKTKDIQGLCELSGA